MVEEGRNLYSQVDFVAQSSKCKRNGRINKRDHTKCLDRKLLAGSRLVDVSAEY
jgi:hypothetical protein